MSNEAKTVIVDNTPVTKIIDDGATRVAPAATVIPNSVAAHTLEEIKEGEVVDGYAVGGLKGDGGEAYVRLAEKDGETYIIKIFKQGRSIDKKTEDILESIHSPFVMPILARGEVKTLHYEILPYYKNGTYGDWLGKQKLSGDKLLKFIEQVNEGLKAIHSADVFHNDIKPENIFLSNDSSGAVIGDFGISKFSGSRTSVTNIGLSSYYAAPESDEISAAQGDYFSFGMTIMNLAYGKNVFEGMSEKAARRAILSGRIPFPVDEIGEDLCDLICMLTKPVRDERITYDGVSDWLKDPKVYQGCRNAQSQQAEGLPIQAYTFIVDGKRERITDAYRLAEAMNNDQKAALDQYKDGYLKIAIDSSLDVPLAMELKRISADYSSDPAYGLFLSLHAINPNLRIKFGNIDIGDFKDYIDVLQKRYPKLDNHLADDAFLDIVLSHSKIEQRAMGLIQTIMKTFTAPIALFDTFLNLFGNTKKFYCNQKTYENFGDFLEQNAFSEKGDPCTFYWEGMRKEFLSHYLAKFDADESAIEAVLSEQDKYVEYFRLGKLFNGHLPFRLVGKPVKNLHDFINLIGEVKESGKDDDRKLLIKFLADNGFDKIEQFEVTRQKDLAAAVKKEKNKLSYVYFHVYPKATYRGCKTIKDLIGDMGRFSASALEAQSKSLLDDEDFKIWLNSQGVRI